jgi:hypothetical protein
MHPQALVQKLASAQERILVASDELAKRNGVEAPRAALEAIKAPSQEIKRMFQLEVIADFLESLPTEELPDVAGMEAKIADMAKTIEAMEAAMAGAQGEPANPDDPQVIAKLADKPEQDKASAKPEAIETPKGKGGKNAN